MARRSFYIRIVVCWVLFSVDSLALLNQELKVEFITTIAYYSSQENKPIVRKLLYNLRKRAF